MKVYALCLVMLFCASSVLGMFSANPDIYLHRNEDDCGKESGATYDNINQARLMRAIPDTPIMNAFSKCMLGRYNIMNDAGIINPNVQSYTIISDLPDSVSTASKECIRRTSGDTARRLMNCYIDAGQFIMAPTPLVANSSGYSPPGDIIY